MKRKAGRRTLRAGEYMRSDGGFEYKYLDPETGRTRSKSARTLDELREKEEEINAAIHARMDIEKGDISLNQLWDTFQELKEGSVKPGTLAQRRRMYNKHIRETRLGNMSIKSIRNSFVKSFYKTLKAGGLAPSTIQYLNNNLFSAMEQALDDRAIPSNPFRNAASDIARKEPPKKKEALSDKEAAALEAQSNGEHYGTLVRFLLRTGLRIGEAAALTWDDIDETRGVIHVRRAFREYQDEGGAMIRSIDTPKTEAGRRDLPLSDELRSILEERKKASKQCSETLDGYDDFIFCGPKGSILREWSFNRFLGKMAHKSIRIPNDITPHTLRRTYSTREVLKGTDLFILMYRLGHSSLSITAKFYINIANQIELGEIEADPEIAEKIRRTARAVG